MTSNPEAMLILMQGCDPASVDIEPDLAGDRYERLFGLRDELIEHFRAGREHCARVALGMIFGHLARDFSEMPDDDERERAQQIITGLFHNPREIEDLPGNVIAVIEDTAVNVGVVRVIIYSYRIPVPVELLGPWMSRYRAYMTI